MRKKLYLCTEIGGYAFKKSTEMRFCATIVV